MHASLVVVCLASTGALSRCLMCQSLNTQGVRASCCVPGQQGTVFLCCRCAWYSNNRVCGAFVCHSQLLGGLPAFAASHGPRCVALPRRAVARLSPSGMNPVPLLCCIVPLCAVLYRTVP
jgi:hypothetical protein